MSAQKEKLEISLANLKVNKNDLSSELSELELSNKKQNSEYNKLANELNEVNIQISKCEIKLDNYLLRLNEEYGLTYERAKMSTLNQKKQIVLELKLIVLNVILELLVKLIQVR